MPSHRSAPVLMSHPLPSWGIAKNAPGKYSRKHITLTALFYKFSTDVAAEPWTASSCAKTT